MIDDNIRKRLRCSKMVFFFRIQKEISNQKYFYLFVKYFFYLDIIRKGKLVYSLNKSIKMIMVYVLI